MTRPPWGAGTSVISVHCCPRCQAPMRIIERLTAFQLNARTTDWWPPLMPHSSTLLSGLRCAIRHVPLQMCPYTRYGACECSRNSSYTPASPQPSLLRLRTRDRRKLKSSVSLLTDAAFSALTRRTSACHAGRTCKSRPVGDSTPSDPAHSSAAISPR